MCYTSNITYFVLQLRQASCLGYREEENVDHLSMYIILICVRWMSTGHTSTSAAAPCSKRYSAAGTTSHGTGSGVPSPRTPSLSCEYPAHCSSEHVSMDPHPNCPSNCTLISAKLTPEIYISSPRSDFLQTQANLFKNIPSRNCKFPVSRLARNSHSTQVVLFLFYTLYGSPSYV